VVVLSYSIYKSYLKYEKMVQNENKKKLEIPLKDFESGKIKP
jgi:hypothetical protein